MKIDLHTHSKCSDGTDSPAELVAKAGRAGLDVLGLTDHDTTDGWAEAGEAADRAGLHLVRGLELSTKNNGASQHLLAYEPDPTCEQLTELLAAQQASRRERVPAMVAKLVGLGFPITIADVIACSGSGVLGKPHVADALVAAGFFTDRGDVLNTVLAPGGPAYVSRYKPSIEDAIAAVLAAGGVPVVAHPWGRKTHVTQDRFAELAACGLAGIEVDHQEHDAAARAALRQIAANLSLLVTGSSDYHGAGKVNHELGCNTTAPEQYERLLAQSSSGP